MNKSPGQLSPGSMGRTVSPKYSCRSRLYYLQLFISLTFGAALDGILSGWVLGALPTASSALR
jgi:hypothetical protein